MCHLESQTFVCKWLCLSAQGPALTVLCIPGCSRIQRSAACLCLLCLLCFSLDTVLRLNNLVDICPQHPELCFSGDTVVAPKKSPYCLVFKPGTVAPGLCCTVWGQFTGCSCVLSQAMNPLNHVHQTSIHFTTCSKPHSAWGMGWGSIFLIWESEIWNFVKSQFCKFLPHVGLPICCSKYLISVGSF